MSRKDNIHRDLGIYDGFSFGQEFPEEIEIDDFSEEDLLKAAKISLPSLYSIIEKTLKSSQSIIDDSLISISDSYFGGKMDSQAADIEMVNALRHPALFRCLLELNEDNQKGVLYSDEISLRELVRNFIKWCSYKIHYRRFGAPSMNDIEKFFKMLPLNVKFGSLHIQEFFLLTLP